MKELSDKLAQLRQTPFLVLVGLLGWWVPGAGHLVTGRTKHGVIIFAAIVFTFLAGIYIASIAVIDPVNDAPWYWAQLLNSPFVILLGHISQARELAVYAKPREIGQIYTGVAGLMNLLCIVNAVYLAHCDKNPLKEES